MRKLRTRLNEPFRIERYTASKPTGVRDGAGHRKEMADVASLRFSRLIIPPLYALEAISSFEGSDFSAGHQGNCRIVVDAPNQIARHTFGQPTRPHKHVDVLGSLREKECGLAGGIPSTDHDHFVATTQLR